MTNEQIAERLVNTIESVAPKAWALLVEQMKIEAQVALVQEGGSLLAAGLIAVVILSIARKLDEDEASTLRWFCVIPTAMAMIVLFVALPSTLAQLIRPDVYVAYSLIHK